MNTTGYDFSDLVHTPGGLMVVGRVAPAPDGGPDRIHDTNDGPGWGVNEVRHARPDELDAYLDRWLRVGTDGYAHINLPRPMETQVYCETNDTTDLDGRRNLKICPHCTRRVVPGKRDLLAVAMTTRSSA